MSLQGQGFGKQIYSEFIFTPGTTTNNDTLVAATPLPASGSFIDVSAFAYVHIVLRFGAIDVADVPVLEPKVSDANNGTLDVIDAGLVHTAAADDDNQYVAWTIRVQDLAEGHFFMALVPTSGVTNGTLANVTFYLGGCTVPVTQDETVLPTTSQYTYAAGQVFRP